MAGALNRPRDAHAVVHLLLCVEQHVREAEVDELELGVLAVALVHEVVELDVAMAHVALVAVEDGRDHLAHQPRGQLLAEAALVLLEARDQLRRARATSRGRRSLDAHAVRGRGAGCGAAR